MIIKFATYKLKSTSTPMTFDVYETYTGKKDGVEKEKIYGYNMRLDKIGEKYVNDKLDELYPKDEEISFKEFMEKAYMFLDEFEKYVSNNLDKFKSE